MHKWQFLSIFPLSFVYKCKNDSLLGSHPQEGKEKLMKYLVHWLERALQVVTGPQKEQPKANASTSNGNANQAGMSAQVPRSSLVCDMVE